MNIKNKNDWCFRFFNNPDYLDIYRDMTGPARTDQEIDFCSKVLQWKKGQAILDSPCGAGRHSFELSRRGYSVTGLDFSSYLLEQAHNNIQQLNGTRPVFVRGLLQQLPFPEDSFDYLVCLFSSYGYGESDYENFVVMQEFNRVLRPGGKLLIDVMNRHFIVPRLNAVYESVQSNLKVREERSFSDNGRRLHNCINVEDANGAKRQYYYRPWLFNGWELSLFATQAGLSVDAVYGNFQADPYNENSERAMLVAEKKS